MNERNTFATFMAQPRGMKPQRAHTETAVDGRPQPLASRPKHVSADALSHASPARDLQSALAQRLQDESDGSVRRWPGAVRLLIIGGGSALLWVAVITGVRAII